MTAIRFGCTLDLRSLKAEEPADASAEHPQPDIGHELSLQRSGEAVHGEVNCTTCKIASWSRRMVHVPLCLEARNALQSLSERSPVPSRSVFIRRRVPCSAACRQSLAASSGQLIRSQANHRSPGDDVEVALFRGVKHASTTDSTVVFFRSPIRAVREGESSPRIDLQNLALKRVEDHCQRRQLHAGRSG